MEPTCENLRSTRTVFERCGRSILIVDDTESTPRLAAKYASMGFHVHVADNADQALAVAARKRPWLTVVEWNSSELPGTELIAELKRAVPESRIVVVTANGSVAKAQQAIRAGAVDYLSKPLTPQEVLSSALEGASESLPSSIARVMKERPSLDEARLEYIQDILWRCGSIAQSARVLGVDRRSLRRMLLRLQQVTESGGNSNPAKADP